MRILFLLLTAVSLSAQPFGLSDPALLGRSSSLLQGLVGYWQLDEASGVRWDRSGNGNHLTDNNGVSALAIREKAATFVRTSSQYFTCNASSIPIGTNSMSVCGWVRLASKGTSLLTPTHYRRILGRYDYGTTNRSWGLLYDTDTDRFRIFASGDGATITNLAANTFGSPSLNTWYFLSCVYNSASNTLAISVNGGTQDTSSFTNGLYAAGATPLSIGTFLNIGTVEITDRCMDGNLDELVIYSRALSATEISTLYNAGRGAPFEVIPKDSLVSYWKLDETSGTRYDSWGTNHLTDNNSVGSTGGKVGNAGTFVAASSQWLSGPTNASLSIGSQDFSVSAWIKLTDLSATYTIASKITTTGDKREWMIYHDPGATNSISFQVNTNGTNGGWVRAGTTNALTAGTWIHCLGVKSNSVIYVYRNAVLENSASIGTNTVFSSDSPFGIGAVANPLLFLNGAIDEVGLWKRVLTAAEITQLYNSGNGVTFPRFRP